MKILFILLFAMTAVNAEVKAPKGFKALFNGNDLSGWWGVKTEDPVKYMEMDKALFKAKKEKSLRNIKANWKIENGELVNNGRGLYLTTDKYYGDFELLLDYKSVAKADSGIYLRGIPQVQIWTKKNKRGKVIGSGGLWNNPWETPGKDPSVVADKPEGEWNHFRIIMLGENVTVYLNDILVVKHAKLYNYFDKNKAIPAKGPIQLQTHGGKIQWKNIFIREFSPSQAKKLSNKLK
ncbi:MAG: DUF1080 domain-containing protein [Lentisphaeraceae bacterium]|nr:DUF1080 domain-containing protein [Lentisphaeraceae bacterium]